MRIQQTMLLVGLLFLPQVATAGLSLYRTGDVILKMCQGADKIPALAVMCHSYLNGFLDATAYDAKRGGKGGARFCLGEGDQERIPAALVTWLRFHPDALKLDAGEALHRMLGESFPCGNKH